ncbi:ProQ/FinO family protein [Legionella sp.]|uniref:ProQ/FinO family protein n=1 Tax=Legionella sp. TaxID=459 RepID=UPI003CB5ABC7
MRKQELHPRTVVINKTQKIQSKNARTNALLWLAANFPAAFDNSVRIRPLKTGIMEDILLHADKAAEEGISKSKLREAVVIFTRRLDYLACLKLREMRVDLQGNDVIEVSIEEAEYAAVKIKKRVEKGVRNARKLLAEKTAGQFNTNKLPTSYPVKAVSQSAATDEYLPSYPARSYATQNIPSQPIKSAAAVIVKHKSTRQYDPDAVARLKEKLGLSRSLEEKKESID